MAKTSMVERDKRRLKTVQKYAAKRAELKELIRDPKVSEDDKAAAQAWEDRHIFFAYVLLALIVIHLAAALWHHFVRRDRVAARMIDGQAV